MSADELCQVCRKVNFRYTCPRCDITYCSVTCYKSQQHIKCSEQFYKECIQDELISQQPDSTADVQKIYEILKRIRESDAGIHPSLSFPDGLNESLDSDDEPNEIYDNEGIKGSCIPEEFYEMPTEENEEDDQCNDIAARLQGIDLNDADEIWRRLTDEEREDFQQLVKCGDIMKLLPDYKPWWIKKDQDRKDSKIVDLSAQNGSEESHKQTVPKITTKISKLSDICKKPPSSCVHYNLWNILTAYACTVRFFGGEQLTNAWEAAAHLVNLCVTLKYNTNFEDAEDAIISVKMESISNAAAGSVSPFDDTEQLKDDAKQLMASQEHKLAALSDILQMFQLARQHAKRIKKEDAEFQKLFVMCSGNIELNRNKLHQLEKKVDFLLAYVLREHETEENLK